MFVPRQYREPHRSWMTDVIRNNPMALMTSNGVADGDSPGAPFATHLPVIPNPETGGEWPEDLSGTTLLGHMNRANPHWAALGTGSPVLLVFTGPHAYVSPTVYGTTPAAPTWNFTSVHVHGVMEKLESREETLEVVESTVRAFEGDFGNGWDMSESIGYFHKLAPAVGAFRVRVVRADGMFKLSQEQASEVRERVQRSFADRECGRHQATAKLMSELPCART
ncbi:FMN-binding negative transcriptional regulator [Streptomyces sp. NPDC008141]|uniref:FMN-binding negative transcriptional regulator n=1 Tax=Streptomyces sp. NPDC008141 TaxID=3364815 RepID=UPI0036E06F6B